MLDLNIHNFLNNLQHLQVKFLNTFFAPFGALFQELHTPVYPIHYDKWQVVFAFRTCYVISFFLLVTSYVGNLKATFINKPYEDSIASVQEILDRCYFFFWTINSIFCHFMLSCRGLPALISSDDVHFMHELLAFGEEIPYAFGALNNLSIRTDGVFDLRLGFLFVHILSPEDNWETKHISPSGIRLMKMHTFEPGRLGQWLGLLSSSMTT